MVKMELGGKTVTVDDDYYLVTFEDWDNEVVKDLARMAGIEELTEEHWKVINYLRDYYGKFRIASNIKSLTKGVHMVRKKMYDIFPLEPAAGACKVAGLPKPSGVV